MNYLLDTLQIQFQTIAHDLSQQLRLRLVNCVNQYIESDIFFSFTVVNSFNFLRFQSLQNKVSLSANTFSSDSIIMSPNLMNELNNAQV